MKRICYVCILLSLNIWSLFSQSANKEINLPENYMIAYNVNAKDSGTDNYEIMIMNSDGTNKKNLTQHKDVAWTYYAYRDRLFFVSDRDTCYRCYFLYEMNSSGQHIKKVTDLQLEDSWMSSRNKGKEMVVTGRIGKEMRFQIFMVNLEDGSFKQITKDTSARYGDPCFSPDGKQIVYSYKKDKRDRNTHEELFVMNADGSGKRQLTTYPEDNPSAKEYGYRAGAARWHPTENFISYVSKQDGRHSIFAITPDGKKQWKLIDNPQSEGWHDWSSDGKWLVYNHSDNEESQFNIVIMNWKTKQQQQVTENQFSAQQSPVFVEK
jgi:TolB protein